MTTPYVAYAAAAGQDTYVVPFPYINRTHVKVMVNGVSWYIADWPNSSTVRLEPVPAADSFVEVLRETPIDEQLVQFTDGNVLTAEDLNLAVQQTLYRQQELAAAYDRAIGHAYVRIAEAGGVTVPAVDLFNDIVAEISEAAVVDNFRNRVDEIDLNAVNILNQADEIADRRAEIAAVELRADALENSLDNATNAVLGRLSDVEAEVETLIASDFGTLIQTEATARLAGDEALVDVIELIGAVSGDGTAFVADLVTLRVSPTETFAERFTALSASDAANTAAIAAEATARADAVSAFASQITVISARIDDTEADITAEQIVRSDADAALASSITALSTRVGDAEADIIAEQTARAAGDAAEASARSLLSTRVDGVEANIFNEQTARVAGDNALASDITLLGVRNGDGSAFVLDLNTVILSDVETMGERLQGINTVLGDTQADIAAETNARVAENSAAASERAALTARVNDAEGEIASNAAAITSEATARANEDSALATRVDNLAATSGARTYRQDSAPAGASEGDLWFDSNDDNKAYRYDGSNWVPTDDLRINANEAAINQEATVRADADAAEASARAVLAARVDDAEADILSEQNARATADSAITSDISGILSRMGDAEAAIVTNNNARVSGDSANASSISAVSTRVDDNEASVNTLQSSTNGLLARYGVTLDVNGHVTGFIQNNDGTSGDFIVVADRFAVVDPNGGTPFTPFEINNGFIDLTGTVRINGDLLIAGSVGTGEIASGAVTNSQSNYTSGAVGVGTSWVTVASRSITTTGGNVWVNFGGHYEQRNGTSQADITVSYQILRGSTVVRSGIYCRVPAVQSASIDNGGTSMQFATVDIPFNTDGTFHIFVVDQSASAGTHTYSVQLQTTFSTGTIDSRQIGLLETKR